MLPLQVEGIADRSFGLNVAKMAGLPQKVIALAKAKAIEMESCGAQDTTDAVRDIVLRIEGTNEQEAALAIVRTAWQTLTT